VGDDGVVDGLDGAFKKYNEEQLSVVKLPGGSKEVRPLRSSLWQDANERRVGSCQPVQRAP
jgi:hypothetical protein